MVTLKFCKESAVASSGFGSLPKRAKCDAGGCGHTHTHCSTRIQNAVKVARCLLENFADTYFIASISY